MFAASFTNPFTWARKLTWLTGDVLANQRRSVPASQDLDLDLNLKFKFKKVIKNSRETKYY